ncbi:sensor histidine kinase [Streptomyces sp. NPDC046716]|uniref:sensor histidine kinase n=1 Tax=Streptomyces sp. NPDC046716 TaxID=3157093 RepID=UPI0033D33679
MNASSLFRTAVAWGGLVLYPVALGLTLFGSSDVAPAVCALGVALSAVLLAGVVRRMPLPGLSLILLGTLVAAFAQPSGGHSDGARGVTLLAFGAADVALGHLIVTRPGWQWGTGVALSFVAQAAGIAALVRPENMVGGGVVALLALLVAGMVGLLGRERRTHAEALRTRAVVEAVNAERLRIARELHDMVSHSIGVIAIQSGVAARVVETRPREAREALSAIEDTSRETLAGLRRTLVALRGTDPAGEAPLAPAAGLGDLDALAGATGRDAGVRVDLVRTGPEGALPPDIELAAYRIVQESLTNVVKHAGVDTCRVAVRRGDDALVLEITDAGTGGSATVPGMGITGMRERVSLLHGEFDAGPGPEGGFRVTARIPLPEAGR